MSDGKRRLPVLDSRPPDPSEGRPRWQWVGIGVGVIFLFWMPLAYLAQLLARGYWARRLAQTDPAELAAAYDRLEGGDRLALQAMLGAAPALAFVLAAVLGGMVVGRFDEVWGRSDATIAGGLVALLAAVLAATMFGGSPPALLLAAAALGLVGAGAARLGAWLGRPKEAGR